MEPIELVTSPTFILQLIELEYRDQKQVAKALTLFAHNPSHPSLRLKKRASDGHWEISYSMSGRVLFDWADEEAHRKAIFLSVGHHHIVD
ncbi:MAG: hypothetical protein A2Z21_03030 [Candidatus Fraserbacteria bacterium RBG_16_55_9]|uniref:Uncharacterized protein n=1 Tax=Fraserbacteria sp. (strain RBG_16_55_9) TaxID=1817864 RepID=A0A1F5UVL1_FRAXR|nr:MAG: hypothetical protein A2Z21_03030 [Candidatus Fraserbacteria bacterium RBG_16_55_9]